MRHVKTLVVLFMAVSLLVSGCSGKNKELERQLQGIVEEYVQNLAAQQWDKVLPALSGDALASMEEMIPALQAVDYETKIHELKTKVDFINKDKDRATVEATYIMEQTVPDYGTTLDDMMVVFDLKKIQDQWKIYRISIVNKTPRSK